MTTIPEKRVKEIIDRIVEDQSIREMLILHYEDNPLVLEDCDTRHRIDMGIEDPYILAIYSDIGKIISKEWMKLEISNAKVTKHFSSMMEKESNMHAKFLEKERDLQAQFLRMENNKTKNT